MNGTENNNNNNNNLYLNSNKYAKTNYPNLKAYKEPTGKSSHKTGWG